MSGAQGPVSSHAWPRAYRASRWYLLAFGGPGIVALAGGLALVTYATVGNLPDAGGMALAGLMFAGFGAGILAMIRAARVVLTEDALEVFGLGSHRRLRRDEIARYRWVALAAGQERLELDLRGSRRRPERIAWMYRQDAALDRWLAGIPNADGAERTRVEAVLRAIPALGRTEGDRRREIARSRNVARSAALVTLVVVAWGWLYPRPYLAALAVLALVPLAAVALIVRGGGRWAVWGEWPRAGLELPLFMPGMVLALRALLDFHVMDGRLLLACAVPAVAVWGAALAASDPAVRRRWWIALLVALFMSAYPWGLVAHANALLDRSEGETFRVRVLDGWTGRSYRHVSHNLRLAAWGPFPEPANVEVRSDIWLDVWLDRRACIRLRPGALRVRWYQIAPCR